MQPPQWLGTRGHLLPSIISTSSGTPSVYEPRREGVKKTKKRRVPPHPALPRALCSSSKTRWVQGVLGSTQAWSRSEGWPSNPGNTRLKPRRLMEHGEYKSDWSEINLTRKALLFTKHLHLKRWRRVFVMMLASDRGSVYTGYTLCSIYESGRGEQRNDEIQCWQEEREECSGFFNPIVRHHCCSLPQDHGQAQP